MNDEQGNGFEETGNLDGADIWNEDVPKSKVARVLKEYGLSRVAEELPARWTGEHDERQSLRDLADYVNRELLRSAMADADMDPLEGEVANTYRLLIDDDVSSGMRTQAKTRLERAGVDVDTLQDDFVSHQSVHTYLTSVRDVNAPTDDSNGDYFERTNKAIQRLKGRTSAVVTENIRALQRNNRITVGDFSVLVHVQVYCEDCGTQKDVVELLTDGGCRCAATKE